LYEGKTSFFRAKNLTINTKTLWSVLCLHLLWLKSKVFLICTHIHQFFFKFLPLPKEILESFLFLLESWIIHKSMDQIGSNWIQKENIGSNLFKLNQTCTNLFKLVLTCFLNFRNWKNVDLRHPLQPQNLHAVEHLSCNYETKTN
jgi:hypothetical protein